MVLRTSLGVFCTACVCDPVAKNRQIALSAATAQRFAHESLLREIHMESMLFMPTNSMLTQCSIKVNRELWRFGNERSERMLSEAHFDEARSLRAVPSRVGPSRARGRRRAAQTIAAPGDSTGAAIRDRQGLLSRSNLASSAHVVRHDDEHHVRSLIAGSVEGVQGDGILATIPVLAIAPGKQRD